MNKYRHCISKPDKTPFCFLVNSLSYDLVPVIYSKNKDFHWYIFLEKNLRPLDISVNLFKRMKGRKKLIIWHFQSFYSVLLEIYRIQEVIPHIKRQGKFFQAMISGARLCGDIIYCRQNFKHNILTVQFSIIKESTGGRLKWPCIIYRSSKPSACMSFISHGSVWVAFKLFKFLSIFSWVLDCSSLARPHRSPFIRTPTSCDRVHPPSRIDCTIACFPPFRPASYCGYSGHTLSLRNCLVGL